MKKERSNIENVCKEVVYQVIARRDEIPTCGTDDFTALESLHASNVPPVHPIRLDAVHVHHLVPVCQHGIPTTAANFNTQTRFGIFLRDIGYYVG